MPWSNRGGGGSGGVDSLARATASSAKNGTINIKDDFNAKGDGTTDDTAARDAAIAYALANNIGTIVFPKGTYKFTTGFEFDPNKISLVGYNRTYFDFTSLTSGNAILMRTPGNAFESATAMKNITLLGPKTGNVNAIYYGGVTAGDGWFAYGYELHKVNFDGFATHHLFGSNCFLNKYDRCSHMFWTGDSVKFIDNVGNAGENIEFHHCNWNNPEVNTAQIFDLIWGSIIFLACSWDYMGKIGRLSGPGAPSVRFVGGHIEYGYPVAKISGQSALPMIELQNGSFYCTDSIIFLGTGITQPLLQAEYISTAVFDNNKIRMTSITDLATTLGYVTTKKTGNQLCTIRWTNTYLDVPAPTGQTDKLVKLVNNTGIIRQHIDYFNVSGGTVAVVDDATYGKCLSLTTVNTNTVYAETPLIPVNYDTQMVSEFFYKFVAPVGGTLQIRYMLYDQKGNYLNQTTQPAGAFTDAAAGDWIRKLGIFKALNNNVDPSTAYIKFRVEIFGATGAGANALVQIPYLARL